MKVFDDEKDKLLDHEYDGIKELDNHMPAWWLWLFYLTIVYGVMYWLYYQSFEIGPTMDEQYKMELAEAAKKYAPKDDEPPTEQIGFAFSSDQNVIDEGKAIFMSTGNLCFTCHGNNAEGLVGPNLTDEFWISGCTAEEIASSIKTGFPSKGMMPYGSGSRISDEDLNKLVSYIGSLQGSSPANAKAIDESREVTCNPN